MQASQQHIIHTQEWEIRVPDKNGAQEVHSCFAQLSRSRLHALLNEHFSKMTPANEHLQIDTLELDLGQLPSELTEANILKALDNALKRQFPIHTNTSEGREESLSLELNFSSAKNSSSKVKDYQIARSLSPSHTLSKIEAATQALSYFFKFGRLPWWSNIPAENSISTYIQILLQEQSPNQLARLMDFQQARQRLLATIPEEIYKEVLQGLLPPEYLQLGFIFLDELLPQLVDANTSLKRRTKLQLHKSLLNWAINIRLRGGISSHAELWLRISKELNLSLTSLKQKLQLIWETLGKTQRTDIQGEWEKWIALLSNEDEPKSRSEKQSRPDENLPGKVDDPYSGDIREKNKKRDNSGAEEVGDSTIVEYPSSQKIREKSKNSINGNSQDQNQLNESNDQLSNVGKEKYKEAKNEEQEVLGRLLPSKDDANNIPLKKEGNELTKSEFQQENGGQRKAPGLPTNKATNSLQQKEFFFTNTDEDVPVKLSGLLILGTFLPHLFTNLTLISEGQWISEEAQHRAVHLLHHLATGADFPLEYETVLAKILCGMNPEELLQAGEALSKIEQDACLGLLHAVIGHAPILKNMTPDGLRGSFLIRNGLLSRRDQHWHIEVEKQSFDIVLDRLPWSFSHLKFPWMHSLISVEW